MNEVQREIAKSIGNLLSAIAQVDHNVTEEEVKSIHLIVNENWMFFAKDSPSDFKDYIISGINSNSFSSEEAFEHFTTVYRQNKQYFGERLKDVILKSCQMVANTTNRLNKSELVFLSRLEKLLKD